MICSTYGLDGILNSNLMSFLFTLGSGATNTCNSMKLSAKLKMKGYTELLAVRPSWCHGRFVSN